MTLPAVGCAAVWALAVCVVDIRTMRIPAVLAWAGIAPAVVVALALHTPGSAAVGAVTAGVLYLTLRMISPSSLGGGDLRLAPTVGALSATGGTAGWVLALLGSFAVTAVVGLLAVAVRRGSGRRTRIPHGPGMVLAALVVVVGVATSGS